MGAAKNTNQDKWVQVRTFPYSSIKDCQENLEITPEAEDWRAKIRNFITEVNIPEDRMKLKKIRNQTTHYVLQEKNYIKEKQEREPFR